MDRKFNWPDESVYRLKEMWGRATLAKICQALGCEPGRVRDKARFMGLTPRSKPRARRSNCWSDEAFDRLREVWATRSTERILEAFPSAQWPSIYLRAKRIGLTFADRQHLSSAYDLSKKLGLSQDSLMKVLDGFDALCKVSWSQPKASGNGVRLLLKNKDVTRLYKRYLEMETIADAARRYRTKYELVSSRLHAHGVLHSWPVRSSRLDRVRMRRFRPEDVDAAMLAIPSREPAAGRKKAIFSMRDGVLRRQDKDVEVCI